MVIASKITGGANVTKKNIVILKIVLSVMINGKVLIMIMVANVSVLLH